ncbi:transcription initiation factor TFIID subunit 6 [Clonorchis sinensis]|uniref:Histone H4 n=2 Tax=Clonorchis sinensis TaxID=79923 RepID=G7YTP4_CLOSI|nr:transcription initiation factor TFIID subunit 6 [Clonorchis sinensis]
MYTSFPVVSFSVMDSTERRRLNRLLRKPTPPGLNRQSSSKARLVGRNSHRPSRGGPSSTTSALPTNAAATSSSDEAKQSGISVDVAKLCAEMCGISNLSTPAAMLLQKHLNQIARLLVHNILRVMEQSRRGVPQASDVDLASVLIGLEAPFGSTPANFLPIRTGGRTATSGPGGKVFFIRPDKEIDVKALLLREPAGVLYDVSVVAHWLAVNGKQPVSPQNPPPDFLARMRQFSGSIGKRESGQSVDRNDAASEDSTHGKRPNPPLSASKVRTTADGDVVSGVPHPRTISSISVERRPHEVSQEVMIYFRELTEACVGACEKRRHEALDNATLDPGLQPILPYLVTFITEGVRVNVTNHNLAILIYLMRLVKALVDNSHISLEPYLHLLVPTVITCVLNRQLCAKPITDNHWALRDFAAKQLVTLCNRHNTSTNELYNRVTRELSSSLHSWIDGASAVSGTDSGAKLADAVDSKLSTNRTDPARPDKVSSTLDKRSTSLGTAVNSMNTLYGILVALAEFGAQSLRILVFPLLPSLCHRLTMMVEPPSTPTTEPVDSLSTFQPSTSRLSPADQRSFDFLKVMLTNRIAPLLADWRTRQNLGTTLDDYRAAYKCMATCLHLASRSASTGNVSTSAGGGTSHTNTTSSSSDILPRPSLVTNSSITIVTTTKQEDISGRTPLHLVCNR